MHFQTAHRTCKVMRVFTESKRHWPGPQQALTSDRHPMDPTSDHLHRGMPARRFGPALHAPLFANLRSQLGGEG